MNKIAKIAGLSVVVLLFMAVPAMAQPAGGATPSPAPLIEFSGAFGAALVCIGSAYGIGKLAASALESMARQPEVAGNIQTGMIIAAALIEGFTFFALFICMQQNPWA
ncbi:MAG: ATP synthase F0 subunit C [Pirellulaceae bacterium]